MNKKDKSVEILINGMENRFVPCVKNFLANSHGESTSLLETYAGWIRTQNTLMATKIEIQKRNKPVEVLDVGCGFGKHLFLLNNMMKEKNNRYYGFDIDRKAIRYAQVFSQNVTGFDNCYFSVQNVEQTLKFPDNKFDLVLCSDVIEHLQNPKKTLLEIYRVLKPQGVLLLTTPNENSIPKRVAFFVDYLTQGRLSGSYYRGKGADLDDKGRPVMEPPAGFDHISEMNWRDWKSLGESCGFEVRKILSASVFSGSTFFDKHPFLLSFLFLIEATQRVFKIRDFSCTTQQVMVKSSKSKAKEEK